MKKKGVMLFLALSLVCFSLTGCGQSGTQSASSASTSSKSSSGESASSTSKRSMVESPTNSGLRKLSGKKIAIKIGDKTFSVDLYNNPTTNDFYSQLPLTLTVNNYAGWDEKIVRLQKPLSMEGAPAGDNPGYPEVGYYEPGNWVALYYGHIGYWAGKVPLGRIDATTNQLSALPDGAAVTITAIHN
ncbi:cyclophilin-like fold protein [Sporolactobacillus pectinivorans]|uniref:cyclophilin-like fold protein n=1 Tax=Sporolactobacillus pectinivorans TaxID=1591408 RepID=UPI000C267F47|nr:cyclophilin-like fold protein [Sporolactobacillus pectinivorans]